MTPNGIEFSFLPFTLRAMADTNSNSTCMCSSSTAARVSKAVSVIVTRCFAGLYFAWSGTFSFCVSCCQFVGSPSHAMSRCLLQVPGACRSWIATASMHGASCKWRSRLDDWYNTVGVVRMKYGWWGCSMTGGDAV